MAALISAAIFELFHFRSLSNRRQLIDFATAAAVLLRPFLWAVATLL